MEKYNSMVKYDKILLVVIFSFIVLIFLVKLKIESNNPIFKRKTKSFIVNEKFEKLSLKLAFEDIVSDKIASIDGRIIEKETKIKDFEYKNVNNFKLNIKNYYLCEIKSFYINIESSTIISRNGILSETIIVNPFPKIQELKTIVYITPERDETKVIISIDVITDKTYLESSNQYIKDFLDNQLDKSIDELKFTFEKIKDSDDPNFINVIEKIRSSGFRFKDILNKLRR